jgi:hypothetical protein
VNHPRRTNSSSSKLIARKCINRTYISGRYSLPSAMIACQKSIPRQATTRMRRIGPARHDRRSCPCASSAGRDRSCETTRSPASEPSSPDIDKDFLNLSFSCRCSRTPEAAFGHRIASTVLRVFCSSRRVTEQSRPYDRHVGASASWSNRPLALGAPRGPALRLPCLKASKRRAWRLRGEWLEQVAHNS